MWALDIQQVAKRSEEVSATSAILNKCRAVAKKHDSDIEFLLLNEQAQDETCTSSHDIDDYQEAVENITAIEDHECSDNDELDADSQHGDETKSDDNSSTENNKSNSSACDNSNVNNEDKSTASNEVKINITE